MNRIQILDQFGQPFPRNGRARPDLSDVLAAAPRASRRGIQARYDLAQDTDEMKRHWAAADALDADSANSLGVRSKSRNRSRHETANNGYVSGIVRSHANYVVGVGPKLRMQTGSPGLNGMVEAAWKRWSKAVLLRRKLRCMAMAKTRDGEGMAVAKDNPGLAGTMKLDVMPIETDQCTSPQLPFMATGYIDGIRFDGFGNLLWYDVLPYHPGGAASFASVEPIRVPARFMLHWFMLERPGQHRGMPELSSTLNLGAQGRRFREATVAAAETAADFAGILEMAVPPDDGPDMLRPFSSVEFERRMLIVSPAGAKLAQMKPEHPASTYDMFHRANVSETARPISQPYNVAAADSSAYNYSSGRLDHLTYWLAVDVERADCEDLVLDPLFELFWREARDAYGWALSLDPTPAHAWDWPPHPQIDPAKTAKARKTTLGFGGARLGSVYAEDGLDFEEELPRMAEEYGVSEDEMRAILRAAVFGQPLQQPAPSQPSQTPAAAEEEE